MIKNNSLKVSGQDTEKVIIPVKTKNFYYQI